MSHIQSKQEIRDISFGMVQEQLEELHVNFVPKRFSHNAGNIVAFNKMTHAALVYAVEEGMVMEMQNNFDDAINTTDFLETFAVFASHGSHKMTVHGFLDMRGRDNRVVIEGIELKFKFVDEYVTEMVNTVRKADEFTFNDHVLRCWFD